MTHRLRDRLLQAWGRWVTTHPVVTLAVCGLVASLSVVLAATGLELHSDRSDLVDPNLDWNARYAVYRQDFPRWNDLVVCLEGPADDASFDALARDLAERLRTFDRVTMADAGFLASEAGPRIFLTADPEDFPAALDQIVLGARLIQTRTPNAALDELFTAAATRAGDVSAAADLPAAIAPFIEALEGREPTFDLLGPASSRWQGLTTPSGRLRLVMVSMRQDGDSGIDVISDDLAWLRTTIGEFLTTRGHPDLPWGVTGIPAMEADETARAIEDSTIASIVAFVLVTGMLLLVFRHILIPLLAAVALVIGIAWSFAWVVISVGHLQLLSVIFSAILVGLGIDFALHLIARLRLVESRHDDLPSAMARTFRDVGPGLLTGAITTAAAFGCTAFTAFLGVAEMGVIASGGVVLCLLAILSVFPALLALVPRWRQRLRSIKSVNDHGLPRLIAPFEDRPVRTLLVAGVVATGMTTAAVQVRYDPNVFNLLPAGMTSVTWAKRLADEPGADLWSGLVMTTPEAAPDLVDDLRAHPVVGDVGGMGLLFPPDLDDRLAQVRRRAATVAEVSDRGESMSGLVTRLRFLERGLKERPVDDPAIAATLNTLQTRLRAALEIWQKLSVEERTARFATLAAAWDRDRTAIAPWFAEALSGTPPGPDALPELLQQLWIGTDGQWLLRVAPTLDERSVLEPDRLRDFVQGVREVAPDLLGTPVQIYESSLLIVSAYLSAAVLALAAIFVVLLVDFRNPFDVGCAILPVLVGFAGTFAVMAMIDIPVNFANLMVMPMILGIGVDAGVHAVHRWRSDPLTRPFGLAGGTGQGIALTLATTGIAFASLLIADHRAVRSLAMVMVIGLAVTFLASVTVLPAVLSIRSRRFSSRPAPRD